MGVGGAHARGGCSCGGGGGDSGIDCVPAGPLGHCVQGNFQDGLPPRGGDACRRRELGSAGKKNPSSRQSGGQGAGALEGRGGACPSPSYAHPHRQGRTPDVSARRRNHDVLIRAAAAEGALRLAALREKAAREGGRSARPVRHHPPRGGRGAGRSFRAAEVTQHRRNFPSATGWHLAHAGGGARSSSARAGTWRRLAL